MAAKHYPKDWQVHFINERGNSCPSSEKGKIEIIELKETDIHTRILMLLPGFFQNAHGFDLLPEKSISVIRYLRDKFKLHTFILHPNGIGQSDYVKKSQIDEYAFRDLSAAIHYLKTNFGKDLYVFGHSTGAIALQVFLAGLVVKNDEVVFDKGISRLRQDKIKAAILSAGNVCMSVDDKKARIIKLARFGKNIRFLLKIFGWINARILTKFISPASLGRVSLAYHSFWEFLYHTDNVSKEARKALYDKSLDGTSGYMVWQFCDGVLRQGLRSRTGTDYKDGLKNITIPLAQIVYGLDPLAPVQETRRDSFTGIASQEKELFVFQDQGHEDFMMNQAFHKNLDRAFNYVLQ